MVMFVLDEDNTVFFNFNIAPQVFKVGEIIKREDLDGKHEVIHSDPATVTVKPIR